MYIFRVFKKYIEDTKINDGIFKIINVHHNKYKKSYKTHDNMAIISNYKYDKLHHSSKYINITLCFNKSKIWHIYNMDNTITYVQYRNDILIYLNEHFKFDKDEYKYEFYFINKCLVKHIYGRNWYQHTDFHYEETEGYNINPTKKTNISWILLNLFGVLLFILLLFN